MPVNYQLGKLYKLVSKQTEKSYIGSTCEKYLSNRLKGHKAKYTRFMKINSKGFQKSRIDYVTSFELMKYDDVQIILLENYPCNNKEELHKRERYWIEQHREIAVNKVLPTQTDTEYHKKYKEEHRQEIKEKNKVYYSENKELFREKKKIYRATHKEQEKQYRESRKEERKEYITKYNEENKEMIKRQQQLKYIASQMKKKMENVDTINQRIEQLLSK